MRKVLWKPTKITWQIHLLLAVVAFLSLIAVEFFKIEKKQPFYEEKLAAAKLFRDATQYLGKERERTIGPINKKNDPSSSGLIGLRDSVITSSKGDYISKLTSVNPNWGAVIIDMFRRAKIKKGDSVAVAFSGSFPAINIAVLSAAKAMNLHLIIISSAAASNWGANHPQFSWLTMEKLLLGKGFFPNGSIAVSMGSINDNGGGLSKEGRAILLNLMQQTGKPIISHEDRQANLDSRMEHYLVHAGKNKIKAFVNVGGGTIAVGSIDGKKLFKPGLNMRSSRNALRIDSLLSRFAKQGIPVIHMSNIKEVAAKYDLTIGPTRMSAIGYGKLYFEIEYNKLLAGFALLLIVALLFFFIKTDFGYRIFQGKGKIEKEQRIEPMV